MTVNRQPEPTGSTESDQQLAPSAMVQEGIFLGSDPAQSKEPERRRGQKRRFGAAGLLNVLVTNAVLQFLLASNLVTVVMATLISQVINTGLGYAIYGKLVFRAKGLRHHRPLFRYLLLMTAMWILNAAGIETGEGFGIQKNLAAAALIPCLAVISFCAQKHWVFKQ
jgi:putative flippase GtrA